MPQNEISLSDGERQILESIRQREGFESIDQALEWLVKTAVRNGVRRITGRGRALYPVGGKSKPCA
ncbi:hypothetical protein RC52_21970 [Herbaspirillum rubrisubalbicans]|nr:hypothetical protein [Herbaspirillum rubrisubalbicans]NQE51118.1 hypothetical protein [Herbaspirillum rubrisubalbicans]